jgi:hypothetical protein
MKQGESHAGKPLTGSMRNNVFVVALELLAFAASLPAPAQTVASTEPAADPRFLICQMIESAAQANALPVDFFARLIWQESRFQPDEIGPITRSGEHAQGIAQFMPGTAMERQLYEPFDPVEALPKSGEFLAELRDEFGNLGLAAAAYNAGPERVREFLAGSRDLPEETRRYVLAITGRPVEDWAMPATAGPSAANNSEPQADQAPPNCHDLVARFERAPNPFITEWQGHKVPSWCRALHHPNISVCGPVHLRELVLKVASAMIPRSHVHLFRSPSQ